MNFLDAQIMFWEFVGFTATTDSLRDWLGALDVTWTSVASRSTYSRPGRSAGQGMDRPPMGQLDGDRRPPLGRRGRAAPRSSVPVAGCWDCRSGMLASLSGRPM